MKFWRVLLVAGCLGIAIYLNRILSLELDTRGQLVLVLTGAALLLVCVISMLSIHNTKVPETGKAAIIIGWLITLVFAFEMLSSAVNFQLRFDIEKGIKNTEFARVTYDPEGLFFLDGVIGEETTSSLNELLVVHGKKPLVINSVGGSIEAAMQMADTVSDNQLTVIVASECSSACVLVAIASDNLLALPESQFGFHQGSIFGSNQSGMAQFWAKSANGSLMLALREGGIPESILAVASRTPPEDMHYVSAQQMKSLGIVASILE